MSNKQLENLHHALNNISPLSNETWDAVKPFFHLHCLEEGKEFNKSFAVKKGHLLSSISSVVRDESSPFFVEILC